MLEVGVYLLVSTLTLLLGSLVTFLVKAFCCKKKQEESGENSEEKIDPESQVTTENETQRF